MSTPKADYPFVSVVIPTYRHWQDLPTCLRSLETQTYPRDLYEVIIVNNDPGKECPYPLPADNMSLLVEPREGSYAARNRGIVNAKGEILAFTDADCVPAPDWIEQAVKLFQGNKGLDRLAGNIKLVFDVMSSPAALHQKVFAFNQRDNAQKGTSVTANLWAHRRVFKEIGHFDGELKSNADLQWGLKAQKAGFTITFAPSVIVSHPALTDIDSLLRKARRVYGGHYARMKWHTRPFPIQLVLSLYPFRPPLLEIYKALFARGLTFRQKVLVLWVLIRIRRTQWREHIDLSKGKSPERV